MRLWTTWFTAGLASCVLCGAASAATINLATGFSGGALATSGDQSDDHWTVANATNFKNAPVSYTVFPSNADWGTGGWVANGPNSDWIAADPDNVANGTATFFYTFTLTASQAATASLSGGAWAIDDAGELQLNGHVLSTLGYANWQQLNAFSAPSSDFKAGVNTLVMQTTSADNNQDGARLEGVVNYGAAPAPCPSPPPGRCSCWASRDWAQRCAGRAAGTGSR